MNGEREGQIKSSDLDLLDDHEVSGTNNTKIESKPEPEVRQNDLETN